MSSTHASLALLLIVALGAPAVGDEPQDAAALYRRALTLEAEGQAAAARAAHEQVLAREPDHAASRRALGYVRVEGRWLTAREADAAASAATAPLPAHAAPATAAAQRTRPSLASALVRRALASPDAAAREGAVAALRVLKDRAATAALVKALDAGGENTRVRAAEALGRLGDESVLGALVARWEARSGNFPQVYFAQASQISYIQDFDVEVASTSFIADPIVGVLQEGVVQSFRIHDTVQSFSTVERTALHGALVKLAGADLGSTPAPWRAWLRSRAE